MERRYPIAWDCATDKIREVTYNGMAEDLGSTWTEIERLRALVADMLTLLDEMPVKHPQQAERRDDLRRRYSLDQQNALHSEEGK